MKNSVCFKQSGRYRIYPPSSLLPSAPGNTRIRHSPARV